MQQSDLRRIPHLWFQDGGIVLQAGHSLFRVYQGVLSAQSSVFADVFSLAELGSEMTDKYDGSPLITLQDDSNEMEDFLRCIFDRQVFVRFSLYIDAYEPLIGVLRLSHKYNCPGLKRWALQ
ncbi:hypothetical protein DL96DRAFT_1468439, partial [Flagelloscypha sp. PMI_526]